MSGQDTPMTAVEFREFASTQVQDGRYELVRGELREVTPFEPGDVRITEFMAKTIGEFVTTHELGYVLGAGDGFALALDTVRIPDVAFVSKLRLPDLTILNEIGIFAPDLAIEVISSAETPRRIHERLEDYLNAGTRLVWNIYPEDKVIEIWRRSSQGELILQKLDEDAALNGEDVLAGFSLPVHEVFSI